MRYFIYLLILFSISLACSSSQTESETSNSTNELDSTTSTETNTQVDKRFDLDQEPCAFLELEKMASILNLKVEDISLDNGGTYCTGDASGIDKENQEKAIRFLYIDKFVSKNGRPNFESMMNTMINNNKFRIPAGPDKDKDVPTRKVEGIGDLAFIYSARNLSTLVYHFNNEIRFTLTLYRKVPGVKFADGFDMPTEELEAKVIELAKAMHN